MSEGVHPEGYDDPRLESERLGRELAALRAENERLRAENSGLRECCEEYIADRDGCAHQRDIAHALLRDIYMTCNLREMPSEHAIRDISNQIEALLTDTPAPEAADHLRDPMRPGHIK